MEPRQKQFSLWYFVATFFRLLALQNYFFAPHTENLSYGDFKTLQALAERVDRELGWSVAVPAYRDRLALP